MTRIEYKRGKALLVFGFFGVCALFFAWIFVSPEDFAHIRKARLLTSGLGRWVFLPLFLVSTGFLALRAGMFALGDALALEMTSTHLRLNGLWGRRQLRWSDVRGAELEINTGQPQLAILTRSGGDFFGNGKVRIPLGLAELSEFQLVELVQAIEDRCNAPTIPGSALAGHGRTVDEARARAPAAAPRPTFGRKQV